MLLSELLASISADEVHGETEREIAALCYDSRRIAPDSLFFALRGESVDGHSFIPAAVAAGAAAVVLEDAGSAPDGVPWIRVANARRAMALMASRFYGDPTDTIPVIAITGTNGKTTTSYLVESILAEAGIAAAVLGTVSYRFADRVVPAPHTTPESVELQRIIREMVDLGAQGVVMEVSSHALDQNRVDGCRFDAAIFSNLTRDHLDYHRDMASYFASKERLFTELLVSDDRKPVRRSVVNMDDPYGREIAQSSACPVVTYGLTEEADVHVRNPVFSVAGIRGEIVAGTTVVPFASRLAGRFNLYNILAAAAAGNALGISPEAVSRGLANHRTVPGRLERVENDREVGLFVDYAHTGDALENVLQTLRDLAGARVITVFGCGGDRDRGKRPVMGEVAGRLSDLAIITSDNPRSENPEAIMAEIRLGILPLGLREYEPADIAAGFTERGFASVVSRREAIRLAVAMARPGDIVLLAGKGHEDYQIIGTERFHFDDREEAAAAFLELTAGE